MTEMLDHIKHYRKTFYIELAEDQSKVAKYYNKISLWNGYEEKVF